MVWYDSLEDMAFSLEDNIWFDMVFSLEDQCDPAHSSTLRKNKLIFIINWAAQNYKELLGTYVCFLVAS